MHLDIDADCLKFVLIKLQVQSPTTRNVIDSRLLQCIKLGNVICDVYHRTNGMGRGCSPAKSATPCQQAAALYDGIMATEHKSSLRLGIVAIGKMLEARRSIGVTELAQHLNIAKSSAHDLLRSLCELGFVEQDPKTARYAISPEIFSFVHQISEQFGVNSKLHLFIRDEAARQRCSIYVGTLSGRHTYILCAAGPVADTTTVGIRTPAFMTSIGRILIAQLPRERWAEFGPQPGDVKLTEWTNLDPKRYLAAVERAAKEGVAWNEQETGRGICSVAAPLPELEGPARRAVAIVHNYSDWVAMDKGELASNVKKLAEKISSLLMPTLNLGAVSKRDQPPKQ